MRYAGSQYRHSNAVADIVSRYVMPDTVFANPYCKRAHVGIRTIAPVKEFYDTNVGIIDLFSKIDSGWLPPLALDFATYHFLRMYKNDLAPYFAEFVGRAATINGELWGKYDQKKTEKRNLAAEAYRGLVRDLRILRDTTAERYSFSYGTLMDLRPGVRYTVYVDVPQDSSTRNAIYTYVHQHPEHIYIFSDLKIPPVTFYKGWEFDTVAHIGKIYLLTSTQTRSDLYET